MQKKVIIIGPTVPYRGGIAQYTTQLHKALCNIDSIESTVISFKKLYPKFLYPGESQYETQPNESRPVGVNEVINVYSPLSILRCISIIKSKKPDLVIISWWTLFWQPAMSFIAWRLNKKGIKNAFLCHNLYDHESRGFKTKISKNLLKLANNYIVHSLEMENQLKTLKPKSLILRRPMPVFDQFMNTSNNTVKRGKLELLFFGFIRPYKGLEDLLSALRILNNSEIYTTVSGEPWEDKEAARKKYLSYGIKNLELNLGYSPEKELNKYFDRADVVVLPYKSATGSAVVAVAYNYLKPVLSTRVGGLADVIEEDKTGWLVNPDSPEELAGAIKRITRAKAISLQPNIKLFCQENSWENMAREIVKNLA